MSQTIAILGISGVGKTSLIQEFVSLNAKFSHAEASALIRQTKSKNLVAQRSKGEGTRAIILENQRALVEAFHDFKRSTIDKHILLDGHSVIDSDDGLVVIPKKVFSALEIGYLIFMSDDVKKIWVRRKQDARRTRNERDVSYLYRWQRFALRMCSEHSQDLKIPLNVVKGCDSEIFSRAVYLAIRCLGKC